LNVKNWTPAEAETPKDLLSETEEHCRDTAATLWALMRRVKQGEFEAVKGVGQATKDLRAAFQTVMEERARLERLCKQGATAAGEGALDLDAARAEIGRRLARLRDARGG